MTNNWKDGGFHLTVNKHGLVSLWDKKDIAQSIDDETYVFLSLTLEQAEMLKKAQEAAKELKEGNGF